MPNNEVKLDEPALWLPSNLDVNGDPLPGEPSYTPRVDRRLIEALITDGVFDRLRGDMLVRQRAAGANMSVEIDPGFAGVAADGQAYAGRYLAVANAVQTVQIDDAPASGARIDLIVARVHDSSITGTRNEAVYEAVKGATDSGGNPVAPALPDSSLPLAQILVTQLVSGQPRVSITDADITDVRVQARVPLGVTETGDPAIYLPGLPPNMWPDGVTTLNVTAADGWPATGVLNTYVNVGPNGGQRVVQHLTMAVGGGVELAYRRSLPPTSGSVWTWSAWGGTPVSTNAFQAATVTRSSTGWTSTFSNTPRVVVTTGPKGVAMVTVGAKVWGTGPGMYALFGFNVYLSGVEVGGVDGSRAFGLRNAPDNMEVTGCVEAPLNLTPSTEYEFVAQTYNAGASALFAFRRLHVVTY